MESILVTGGAGFIGSNLVRSALAALPDRVVVFDNLSYAGSRDNLADVGADERLVFIEGDIGDGDTVAAALRTHRPRAILNLAAETHVDRSIDAPRAFVHTNVLGTFELLEAVRQWLARAESERRESFRFLHVSTDEVFGSLDAEGLFREDTPYDPSSPYSASKASADHLVRAYHRTYGVPILVTNCSNNYGPYQFPEKLIPLTILNAVEAKSLPVYGDGGNVRDWIYVADHCAGLLEVLARGRPGESYNLGGGCEHTNLETVHTLCDVLEGEIPAAQNPGMRAREITSYRELVTFVEDRPGHDRRYAIDATKVRSELGWQPRTDFESGLRSTVRWYLEHRDWCEAVQRRGYRRERLGLAGS